MKRACHTHIKTPYPSLILERKKYNESGLLLQIQLACPRHRVIGRSKKKRRERIEGRGGGRAACERAWGEKLSNATLVLKPNPFFLPIFVYCVLADRTSGTGGKFSACFSKTVAIFTYPDQPNLLFTTCQFNLHHETGWRPDSQCAQFGVISYYCSR